MTAISKPYLGINNSLDRLINGLLPAVVGTGIVNGCRTVLVLLFLHAIDYRVNCVGGLSLD